MTEKNVILVTGKPGVGKTTLIKTILDRFPDVGGFYTREIRDNGVRVGFEIVTLDGKTGLLATKLPNVNFENQVSFGSYKVNIDTVNSLAIPSVEEAVEHRQLIIIDEIGPMELFSKEFQTMITRILQRENIHILGTIVEREHNFADKIKAHPQVRLVTLTEQNRSDIMQSVVKWVMSNTLSE
ncbi:NTPase [Phototrophicus methaneseepsis]|uniref:NTPase n=1 Tax=Phototrophicus methaneseepsis TaxID=2710758 RepID=A0A7S8IDU2_9CHLR|nr:NTPase [Phototrophicus methaneseepsis]QPC81704.1 NTPase [Phototrophicus methaneseepsis]